MIMDTIINEQQMLDALKISLGIVTGAYDDRLRWALRSAKAQIIREGATTIDPENSIDDAQTVVMYADWMWRKRDTGDGMPRMLRWRINNRVMEEKAR